MAAIKLNSPSRLTKGKNSAGMLLFCILFSVFFGAATALVGGVIAALFAFAIVTAAVALANYRIGVWFLVLLLPLSVTTIFPHQMLGITGANPYNALFGFTLLSFLVTRAWKGKLSGKIAYPRFWWAYFAPILLAALIGTQHINEIPSFAFTKELVQFTTAGGYLRDVLIKPITYLLLAFLIGAAIKDGMEPKAVIVATCLSVWLLAAWVFAYVLFSGLGLAQLASSTAREALGPTGMHANSLGSFAALILILMVFAIANSGESFRMRWLYAMTAGISGMLLLLSFSRSGFLYFMVGLTIFFIQQRRLKVVVVGLFLLAFLIPLLPGELFERLTTGVSSSGAMIYSKNDPLTAGRFAGIWLPMLPEVWSHPLFGNGLLAMAWSIPFRSGALIIETLTPHNLYLKILLELGLVGFVLLALFFLDLWRRFRAAAKDPATPQQLACLFNGVAAALIGFVTAGMSGGDFLPSPSNALLWVMFGLLLSVPAGCLGVTSPVRVRRGPVL